jgi:4-alpha-glucanotransferase
MLLQFSVRFTTQFGQNIYISGNIPELGNGNLANAVPMQWQSNNLWSLTIDVYPQKKHVIAYQYIVKNTDGEDVEYGLDKTIAIDEFKNKTVSTFDVWQNINDYRNTFFSQPFAILNTNKTTAVKKTTPKTYTHIFKVKAPLLPATHTICLLGDGKALGNWDNQKPILLQQEGNWYVAKVKLNQAYTRYKYGIYHKTQKTVIALEAGTDRQVGITQANEVQILHDGFCNMDSPVFKGAGVAIPVFSLRSTKSFGVGEFTDIALLVDWAKQCRLKIIQLLPINDTNATGSWTDSYPYAAISAFALHPMYINLSKVAGTANQAIITKLAKKQKLLNALPVVDYEQVMQFKLAALEELFAQQKTEFLKNDDFLTYFNTNKHWLVPYAAFCYLMQKHGTCKFTNWKSHSTYNSTAISRLVNPTAPSYNTIALQYFIQYHLHVQLKEATAYAHKNNIVVKGDIPIGIYRHSVDAWVAPELYNMQQQAGAPPDDFAVLGQNWGFPTYNWQQMQKDNFAWWRQRFEQMSFYFDAFRIDHILGFFRIWSIPLHAVQGILGKFVPALALHKNEFEQNGIYFDTDRFCKPYTNQFILQQTFGEHTNFVLQTFFDGLALKPQFTNQLAIQQYCQANDITEPAIVNGLFDVISNVILLLDDAADSYHFRIAMDKTTSFKNLDGATQHKLQQLYNHYFYYRHDDFWKQQALQKLPALKAATNMLICGEDLGMVPHCVPQVMQQLSILSLEIQRMPKDATTKFFHPNTAPYLSVVTPSTHDMSTIRGWWQEDANNTQQFYNQILGQAGQAPFYCEPWINKIIIEQHFYSPAMFSIFQLQDLLGADADLRRNNPDEERINQPANPQHYWQYRMHLTLEALKKQKTFNTFIANTVQNSGRG